jgi:hypothetical protein
MTNANDFVPEHPFLKQYLSYVEDTESPRLFHIWSILSGISACLGRRCYFPFGHTKIYPNMYVLLVGPPGVRKSTAISIATNLVKKNSSVRIAPDDTGAQRQGLIRAMTAEEDMIDDDKLTELDMLSRGVGNASTVDAMLNTEIKPAMHPEDLTTMYAVASEFNTFIGHNALELITFLAKMWDGEDYSYQLKESQLSVRNGLMSIIGGTTPTSIATAFPPEAVGQGFMSRIILVHATKKYKNIARPKPFDENATDAISRRIKKIAYDMVGPFQEDEKAAEYLDKLYGTRVEIDDPRFLHYMERRHTHLIKTAMALCAGRGSQYIMPLDVVEAHRLLSHTEVFMSDALGEYGMSPLAVAKQRMVDFLRTTGVVQRNVLQKILYKDLRAADFASALAELKDAGVIDESYSDKAGTLIIYKDKEKEYKAKTNRDYENWLDSFVL